MPKVLVVDDDDVDLELLSRHLRAMDDCVVLQARDGRQALEAVEKLGPDLVVTDLRMPGMDGLELTQKIKEEHPTLPVVVVTSQGSEQIAVRALETGAASYVSKVDLGNSLIETLEQLLQVAETDRCRDRVLACLGRSETRFELVNDMSLISPLVGFFVENLERLHFGTEFVRSHIGIALTEALSNAIIHGNLEVSSDLRKNGTEAYYAMIEERRVQRPYEERRVTCIAREAPGRVEYVIRDEGPGFDPDDLPDPTAPENMERVLGRGLLLIRTFMDEVVFNEKGNEITLSKKV